MANGIEDLIGKTIAAGAGTVEFCVPEAVPVAQELQAARELGLPESYRGIDSKPALRTYSVDNPLPRAKLTSFEDVQRLPPDVIGARGVIREFAISELKSPQDYVQPTAVKYVMDGTYFKTTPLIAEMDGELVLLNGNHATLAAKLKGESRISGTYLGKITK